MAVRMSDVLMLNTMRNARIVAGNTGLRREVKRISFIDCPLSSLTPERGAIGKPGDLYINSLYLFFEDAEAIEQMFKIYVNYNSAGSIIITEYIKELPQNVRELADKANFPIIFIDPDILYADVINEVSQLLFEDNLRLELSKKIDRLLLPTATQRDAEAVWNSIAPTAGDKYQVICAALPDASSMQISRLCNDCKPQVTGVPYKDGCILIVSGPDEMDDSESDKLIAMMREFGGDAHIGVGNIVTDQSRFLRQLRCCIDYKNVAAKLDIPVGRQSNLGIYALLCNCEDEERLREYCTSILGRLAENDKRSDLRLVDTVKAYMRCNGNYKIVASEMHQHENTIRFRISKARELLGFMDSNFEFLEAISVATKAAELLGMYQHI